MNLIEMAMNFGAQIDPTAPTHSPLPRDLEDPSDEEMDAVDSSSDGDLDESLIGRIESVLSEELSKSDEAELAKIATELEGAVKMHKSQSERISKMLGKALDEAKNSGKLQVPEARDLFDYAFDAWQSEGGMVMDDEDDQMMFIMMKLAGYLEAVNPGMSSRDADKESNKSKYKRLLGQAQDMFDAQMSRMPGYGSGDDDDDDDDRWESAQMSESRKGDIGKVDSAAKKLAAAGKRFDDTASSLVSKIGDPWLQSKFEDYGWQDADSLVAVLKRRYMKESIEMSESEHPMVTEARGRPRSAGIGPKGKKTIAQATEAAWSIIKKNHPQAEDWVEGVVSSHLTAALADGEITEETDAGKTKSAIAALRDEDYKDKDDFFKMTQLLTGIAGAAAKGDETAKKFLSQLSDDLTGTAKSVLGGAKSESRLAEDGHNLNLKERPTASVFVKGEGKWAYRYTFGGTDVSSDPVASINVTVNDLSRRVMSGTRALLPRKIEGTMKEKLKAGAKSVKAELFGDTSKRGWKITAIEEAAKSESRRPSGLEERSRPEAIKKIDKLQGREHYAFNVYGPYDGEWRIWKDEWDEMILYRQGEDQFYLGGDYGGEEKVSWKDIQKKFSKWHTGADWPTG